MLLLSDRQGVDISANCFFVRVFVRLRISPPRIKQAASNFTGRFIDVQGRKSPIFVNFAPPEAQNQTNRPARHHLHDVHNDYPLAPEHMTVTKDMFSDYITVEMRRRKRHAGDAPLMKSRGVWT